MEFSRQEFWSGLPSPSPGDLPNSGIEPGSLALHTDSLLSESPGKPWNKPWEWMGFWQMEMLRESISSNSLSEGMDGWGWGVVKEVCTAKFGQSVEVGGTCGDEGWAQWWAPYCGQHWMFRWGIYTNNVGNKEQMKETGGFPGGASGKEPACQRRRHKRHGLDPWAGKIPWRRAWKPTPVFLLGESFGQRSLVGYGP